MENPGRSVLLLENDEDLREVFSALFLEENLTVKFAGTIEEAREVLNKGFVDVGVLDLESLEPSSHGGFAELKVSHPAVPLVVCSIYYDEPEKLKALGAPADSFLPKPFEQDHVISMLRDLLDKSGPFPGMKQEHERRKYPRRCVRDATAGIDRKGPSFVAQVRDIGPGGIGLESEFPIPPSLSLNLRIKVPVRGRTNSLNTLARTVWVSKLPERGTYAAGFKFIQVDPFTESSLLRVMQA